LFSFIFLAAALGAAGISRTLAEPNPPAQEEGSKGKSKAGFGPVVSLAKEPWIQCAEGGMGDVELGEALALEGRFLAQEQVLSAILRS
jgi:hypothetical protein